MVQQQNRGFTLVELIIVISIIAVLSSLAFMALQGETAQARDSKRDSDLKTYENSIATSSGKNKKVHFEIESGNTSRDGSGDEGSREAYQTNNGTLIPIRGAYLIPVNDGVFESDVLPTAARDPKGSPYLGTFLSSTDYLLFGSKENPDTKTPTAIVRGSFKEGSILDVLTGDIDESVLVIPVANPRRFVAGDVIKIDNEEMTVVTFNTTTKELTVTRASNSTTANVHNKSAKIKLVTARVGADSLLCLGGVQTAAGTPVDTTVAAAWTVASDIMDGTASVGMICEVDAVSGYGPIVDGGSILPYNVVTE